MDKQMKGSSLKKIGALLPWLWLAAAPGPCILGGEVWGVKDAGLGGWGFFGWVRG